MSRKRGLLYCIGFLVAGTIGFISGNYFNEYYNRVMILGSLNEFKEEINKNLGVRIPDFVKKDYGEEDEFESGETLDDEQYVEFSKEKLKSQSSGLTSSSETGLELKIKYIDAQNNEAILNGSDGRLYFVKINEKNESIILKSLGKGKR